MPLVRPPVPTPFVNQTIRFDCFPDFQYDAATNQYIGIARGRRPGDLLGYAHSWFPQCVSCQRYDDIIFGICAASKPSLEMRTTCCCGQAAAKSRIPPAVCDRNFRTFAFMTSPDLKRWEVTAPPQPATKEHQTYTTAAFRFHDITLATTSIFEETTAADDFGFVRCSMYFTSNRQI